MNDSHSEKESRMLEDAFRSGYSSDSVDSLDSPTYDITPRSHSERVELNGVIKAVTDTHLDGSRLVSAAGYGVTPGSTGTESDVAVDPCPNETILGLTSAKYLTSGISANPAAKVTAQLSTLVKAAYTNANLISKNVHTLQKLVSSVLEVSTKMGFEKCLHIFPFFIELLGIAIANHSANDIMELVRLFSCLVWKSLIDQGVHSQLSSVSLLDLLDIHAEKLLQITSVLTYDTHSSNFEGLYFDEQFSQMSDVETASFFASIVSCSIEVKKEISGMHFGAPDNTDFGLNRVSIQHTQTLSSLFEFIDSSKKKEFVSLFLLNERVFLRSSISPSPGSKKLLELIQKSILPKHPKLFFSNQDLFNSLNSSRRFDAYSLVGSFRFLLELTDQGTNLNYLRTKSMSNMIVLSLSLLSQHSYLDLYSNFNRQKSKSSLLSVHTYLNYMISLSLLREFSFSKLPMCIVANFEFFKLPPLPMSKWFLEELAQGEENETLNEEPEQTQNTLIFAMLLNIKQISAILPTEFKQIENMNEFSSTNISKKLTTNLVNTVLSSILSVFTFLQIKQETSVRVAQIKAACYQVLFKLVNLDLAFMEKSLIWVCLVNFANDVCYAQLQYLPIFEQIFDYLIAHDVNALGDPLVSSGLNFFFSTFSTRNEQSEDILVEVPVEEYKYLYENISSPKAHSSGAPSSFSFNNDVSRNNISTPIRQNYATNSARQQSIHVDQYGK